MTEDTGTIDVVQHLPTSGDAKPARQRRPDNTFLVISTALWVATGAALWMWRSDEQVTHAQTALFATVAFVVSATAATILHFVRAWIRTTERRLIAAVEAAAKNARCQHYDLGVEIRAQSARLVEVVEVVKKLQERRPKPGEALAEEFADYLRRSADE